MRDDAKRTVGDDGRKAVSLLDYCANAQIGGFREELWMTSFESSFFLEGPDPAQAGFDRRVAMREVA